MPTVAQRVFEPDPAPPEGPEFLTRALQWIRRQQPPPTPMATAVFPEIRRDPFWEVMKGPMTEAGTPGASRILDPGTEAGVTGMQPPPAGWRERLGQFATFAGNALPFRGTLREPLLGTKAKYLHPTTGEEPTRVYHGTPQAFGEFKMSTADPGALYGPGLYFTEEPKVAGGYALHRQQTAPLSVERPTAQEAQDYFSRVWDQPGEVVETKPGTFTLRPYAESGNIRPAHLDIRKPFDADDFPPDDFVTRLATTLDQRHGAGTSDYAMEKLEQAEETMNLTGDMVYRIFAQFAADEQGKPIGKAALNEALQALGYDGITHTGGAITGTKPHRVWIAFSPKQVVSPFEYARTGQREP